MSRANKISRACTFVTTKFVFTDPLLLSWRIPVVKVVGVLPTYNPLHLFLRRRSRAWLLPLPTAYSGASTVTSVGPSGVKSVGGVGGGDGVLLGQLESGKAHAEGRLSEPGHGDLPPALGRLLLRRRRSRSRLRLLLARAAAAPVGGGAASTTRGRTVIRGGRHLEEGSFFFTPLLDSSRTFGSLKNKLFSFFLVKWAEKTLNFWWSGHLRRHCEAVSHVNKIRNDNIIDGVHEIANKHHSFFRKNILHGWERERPFPGRLTFPEKTRGENRDMILILLQKIPTSLHFSLLFSKRQQMDDAASHPDGETEDQIKAHNNIPFSSQRLTHFFYTESERRAW